MCGESGYWWRVFSNIVIASTTTVQQHIKQAECEAEAQIIDNPSEENKSSKNQEDDVSSNSFMMDEDDDDNSSSSKQQQQSKKKTVEIRADHITKIAAELLLDLS